MFSKSFIFAASALPVALGLTWNTPTNVTSGLVSNISWTSTSSDSVFSVELNHPSFSNSIAIANNVDPQSVSSLSIEWPIVPADADYSLSAVNIGNITDVFAQSGDFNIAQAPTSASATFCTTFAVTSSGASGSTTGASSGATTGATTGATLLLLIAALRAPRAQLPLRPLQPHSMELSLSRMETPSALSWPFLPLSLEPRYSSKIVAFDIGLLLL